MVAVRRASASWVMLRVAKSRSSSASSRIRRSPSGTTSAFIEANSAWTRFALRGCEPKIIREFERMERARITVQFSGKRERHAAASPEIVHPLRV